MPKVEAWLCEHTNKLFRHRADYISHLRKLRREHAKILAMSRIDVEVEAWIAQGRNTSSFDDLADWLILEFPGPLARLPQFTKHGEALPRIIGWSWNRMEWKDSCSNSHAAPAGKPTNWHGLSNLPHGYPGWIGEVRFHTTNSSWHISDALKMIGIHFGGGGGGTVTPEHTKMKGAKYGFRFGVTLFAEEWESLVMMEALKGDPTDV
jgi:hypothetical protein